MLKKIFFVSAVVMSFNVFAAPVKKKSAPPTEILVKTELSYESAGKKVETSKEYIFSGMGRGWTTLIPPQNGVTVVAKILSADAEKLSIEAVLVDTNQTAAAGCSVKGPVEYGKRKDLPCPGATMRMTIKTIK